MHFNNDYFKAKVAESRERKKEQRERVRRMLAESRSTALSLQAAALDDVPGLVDALNGLTMGLDEDIEIQPRDGFDLKRYETHIQAHIGEFPVSLEQIPPLGKNPRKDRIWRFIAIIFLDHYGIINIWQEKEEILVVKT